MRAFFQTVLRFRLLILAVAVGLLSFGFVQLRSSSVDMLPEFTPPYAEIQTEALGLSAEEVEQLITVPLEANMLNGVEGVDVIRSESVPGLSSIVLVFEKGTDVYRARQLVGERLTQAVSLPRVSRPPTLLQPLSSSNRVVMIGLSSNQLSPIEQSVIASWTMRPRLMGVPGVANVSVWGMRDQQLQVQVDPARLKAKGVTLSQIIQSTGNAQVVSPLSFLQASTPGTGGFIETPQQRLQVRHLLEKMADPGELAKVPVVGTNGRLRLSDVANIKVDHQPLIGDAVVAGGPGLMLVVEKFPGADTIAVSEGVEEALETLRPGLTGLRTDTTVFKPAEYIQDALGNIGVAFLVGGLLMLVALVALRFQWRAVLIAIITVPLSLLVAGLLLQLFGQGFNALVFAGLAAAVAVVVDEAVTPTNRVIAHLWQQRQVWGGEVSVASAVRDASTEIRRPLLYATLILLLAVVPVAALGGRPGEFFSSLVLAYALAVVAAMLVALTVTPALTVFLFSRWQPKPRTSTHPQRFQARYVALLQRFSRPIWGAVIAAGVLALLGLITLPFLGMSVVPTFKDRNVLVRLDGQPGTSNPKMTKIAADLSAQLEGIEGVGSVGASIGRAVTGDRVINVNSADIWVNIESGTDYDAAMSAIEDAAAQVEDVNYEVLTYATQKMRDVGALIEGKNSADSDSLDLLTGLDSPFAVRVYGDDPKVLQAQAEQIRAVMTSVDGVVNPRVDLPTVQPTIEIEVDLTKAQALGVTPGDVRRAEATLLQGIHVGSVFEQQKVFDVIVQGDPSTRGSVENVRKLLIDKPSGGHFLLGDVADVRVVDTPSVIRRDAVSRRMDVVADISGRNVGDVAADIQQRLAQMDLPLGYHAEVLQASTQEEIGTGRVLGFAITAALAAFLLLQAAFKSWRLAALVFAVLPLSLVGGLVVALVDGSELSIGSLIGFLALFGLATRMSILLVNHLQSLETGGAPPGDALVARGARDRLQPVTASAAALAAFMLPFAVLGSRAGLELVHPMALVLLGGLVTSTFVMLFLLPALYQHLAPRGPSREDDDGTAQRLPDVHLASGNRKVSRQPAMAGAEASETPR